MRILGISAFYHDSAAALVEDGEIVAAAQEERFTRKKHDASFPRNAVEWCLRSSGVAPSGIDYAVFYDKPWIKFERMLETYFAHAPRGLRSFLASMPIWLREKLNLKATLRRELELLSGASEKTPPLLFTEHHQAHAASAFFASPFQRAAVLCLDGVGEWATTSVWLGEDNRITPLWEIDFPHSIGLLYSAFTYYIGFKVNAGEYKLMGLAPYGEPRHAALILDRLIDLKPDGSFRLNMDYFNYPAGLTMTNSRFDELFGGPPRSPEAALTQREMDLAASIQAVTEEVVLRLANTVRRETGAAHLCLAGGVALNCVANGKIIRSGNFDGLWVQPAAGDAGGAIGAALAAWHLYAGRPRIARATDLMRGSYLGPEYSDDEIRTALEAAGARYRRLDGDAVLDATAAALARGCVVGWFQGRMEFGPRALGNRSILGDPRDPNMQSALNLKIKFRESFRPFAPAVLAERTADYFDLGCPSPYMALVAPVAERVRLALDDEPRDRIGLARLGVVRSAIPAVTHVDCSARIQTVHRGTNPRFHELIRRFEARTGCPVLINTSFNVRGEPIVCTPEDAYRCFMGTGIDHLVVGNYVMAKDEQLAPEPGQARKQEFAPD
ncbi:MAG: carbamoyltransferase family protein [Candidatus Binataceae bacterium]